jgi:hypothetical protein
MVILPNIINVGVEHLRHYLATLHYNLHSQMLYPLCFYRSLIPAVWGLSVKHKGKEKYLFIGCRGIAFPPQFMNF